MPSKIHAQTGKNLLWSHFILAHDGVFSVLPVASEITSKILLTAWECINGELANMREHYSTVLFHLLRVPSYVPGLTVQGSLSDFIRVSFCPQEYHPHPNNIIVVKNYFCFWFIFGNGFPRFTNKNTHYTVYMHYTLAQA